MLFENKDKKTISYQLKPSIELVFAFQIIETIENLVCLTYTNKQSKSKPQL